MLEVKERLWLLSLSIEPVLLARDWGDTWAHGFLADLVLESSGDTELCDVFLNSCDIQISTRSGMFYLVWSSLTS